MQYEFRGRTLNAAVAQALGQKNNSVCDRLRRRLDDLSENISQSKTRLARLERTLLRIQDAIEADKERFDGDDIRQVLAVIGALGTLIPAVRITGIAVGAARAGVSIAQSIRNGMNVRDAIAGLTGASAGIAFLSEPSYRRQLRQAQAEVENEAAQLQRLNENRLNVLDQMQQNACENRRHPSPDRNNQGGSRFA